MCEKKRKKKKVLFPAQTSNYLSNISQPLTPFHSGILQQYNIKIISHIERVICYMNIVQDIFSAASLESVEFVFVFINLFIFGLTYVS